MIARPRALPASGRGCYIFSVAGGEARSLTIPDVPQPSPTHVTVRFDWTAEEHARALGLEATLRPFSRTLRRVLRSLPWLVLGGTVLLWGLTDASGFSAGVTMLPWFLLAIFWWSLGTWAPQLITWKLKRRLVARAEERTVSDAGLDVAGGLDATFVPWTGVERVVETDEFFLFTCGPSRNHYIPKRTLSSAELAQVRSLVSLRGPSR